MRKSYSCISFDSYIKPQLFTDNVVTYFVVYLLIPTSNHNKKGENGSEGLVVYLLIPTSNHNPERTRFNEYWVVYLLIPTSNHNKSSMRKITVRVVYLLIPTSNHNQLCSVIRKSRLYIF